MPRTIHRTHTTLGIFPMLLVLGVILSGARGASLVPGLWEERLQRLENAEFERQQKINLAKDLADFAAKSKLGPAGFGSHDTDGELAMLADPAWSNDAGAIAGVRLSAMEPRVRKASCKNFFWKTFTSC
uniref:Somatostatin/Cortistatin C-terminal domain-containing protein n=1 Tax=Eptatretus burgeri TaxID=7764 RepID=A0A8C4QAT0_EPTBU